MLAKERVMMAICHQEPDRVPRGELLIDDDFLRVLLGVDELNFNQRVEAHRKLGLDLACVIAPWLYNTPLADIGQVDSFAPAEAGPSLLADITRWSRETDLFVFGVLNGVHDQAAYLLEHIKFFLYTESHPREVARLCAKLADANISMARSMVKAGAHGIIIGDDIAYNKGTFLAPHTLRELIFPHIARQVQEIKALGVPVLFHSDGNLTAVLDDIAAMGFNGIHSLQPSAGMDLARIKRDYGNKLCLMGNLDLDYLLPLGSPDEIRKKVAEAMAVAKQGGGYIFGTCGAISSGLPVNNILTMYRAADDFGFYDKA